MAALPSPTLAQKTLIEAVGAFLLTFVGAGSIVAVQYVSSAFPTQNYPGLLLVAFAHGITLAIAVSAAMNISGGHINPAVTICMLVTKRISASNAVAYIVSQLIGAFVAGGLLIAVFPQKFGDATGVVWGLPLLSSYTSQVQGIGFEAIMTFVLVFAVFGTAVDSRAPKVGGILIGLAIAVDIMAGGPFTGAAMNPARAMGPVLSALATGSLPANWPFYVWWIGPVIGAIVAALIYDFAIIGRTRH